MRLSDVEIAQNGVIPNGVLHRVFWAGSLCARHMRQMARDSRTQFAD